MQHFDYLIKDVSLVSGETGFDVAVKDGKIAEIARGIAGSADEVIDAAGRLAAPAFVDSHTHLDKAMSAQNFDANGLGEAIGQSRAFQDSVPIDKVRDNVKDRASIVLDWEAANGTCAIKSHVLLDEKWGMEALYALNELKEEYKDKIQVLNITPYDPAFDKEWREAASNGQIDFIAGYPGLLGGDDYAAETDFLFDLAMEYDLPLDLHVNEADAPDLRCFEYVINKTLETGLKGRVTCGHVTGMNAVPDEQAAEDIAIAKEAGVNIITLPSCNMYLMGRDDKQPVRRGLTRVHEFLEAGVNISFASDNIRDHFRPFGNGDMLEEALFTAQCIQYGTVEQLRKVFAMGTINPAANCLLKDYGLKSGCNASFNLFREKTVNDAIISQHPRTHVFHNGKLIAKNGLLL